ncbi:nucleotidyltransferase domain-containing protein [Ancylobacter pratisalsi]|uniref:Polymerase nucleotidyl transferase domain-containing protein n=1 Tax=Ancylobacter pratisalsi TaxID=1745854 RepID=A0A6P1YHF5_9HYPH|nr:nucleotidyltransferase domain-containing protein [Ancylobacter pratisalsi]QIB32679.1 hypothetical protein G3A50_02405 [Ancylobacter pratisalsi]
MTIFDERREDTRQRIEKLQGLLTEDGARIKGAACVYATGSFGRGETDKNSDLDLFIVSKNKISNQKDEARESRLKRLDEIRLQASLINATSELDMPEFDGDGRYLIHYTLADLKGKLGTPDDDAVNTFTARLLLLLESKPLLGSDVYSDIVDEIIGAYWQDFPDHQHEFLPAFLANDILRLWRTLCVNYEVRTSRTPEEKNIKRRQKNYTLKHSRLLTCYSALLYLLSIYSDASTVSPENAKEMVSLSPTERLERILKTPKFSDSFSSINNILQKYDEFLRVKSDADGFHAMFVGEAAKDHMTAAREIAGHFFKAIEAIGQGNRLHQLLLV